MELEGSSPRSQEPETRPYPAPDQFTSSARNSCYSVYYSPIMHFPAQVTICSSFPHA
jgi:hypothetical protein